MKLRKLILSGFKSFADKTEFEFDDGISCIVGPNGCGKSNVVDAVKWVLGEQSAKSLRGSEMKDVIFNGSSSRTSAGGATVTLVFDNADGLLQARINDDQPPDRAVSVTRRLFRSGQSEYLINKTQCRLRDIREMFMDTGNAYSLIEQGRVEGFLQASQDERRAIFDEAAGISKYKARKREALRKLDRVEQNLLRINDILGEVEKRLRSIKYQAGKARNYQAYSQRLKELRSLYFLSQYHTQSAQRGRLQKRLDTGADMLSQIAVRIDQLQAAESAAEIEAVDLERTARDVQGRIASGGGQITTCQQRREMLAKRVKELGEQIVIASGRCEELEAKIERLCEQSTVRQAELEKVEAATGDLNRKHQAVCKEHSDSQQEIDRLQAQLEDAKTGTIDLLRRTAELHNEINGMGIRRENLHGRRDRLDKRAEQIRLTLKDLLTDRKAGKAKLGEAESVLADAHGRLDAARKNTQSLHDRQQSLNRRISQARENRSAIASRTETLREMQQKREGLSAGVRRVLDAREAGQLPAVRGVLGEFIQTDIEHAPLIEAALAGTDQLLLVDRLKQLEAAADQFGRIIGDNGAVEVLCLDQVGTYHDDFRPADCPQVLVRAIDWVRAPGWLSAVVWRLLGKTLVVRSLSDAAAAAEAAPAGYRFVTLKGDVLEGDGRVRLGAANRAAGVVTRKSELLELQTQQEQLDRQITDLQSRAGAADGEIERLDQLQQKLRTVIYEANTERVECRSHIKQLTEQIGRLEAEMPLIAADRQTMGAEIEAAIEAERQATQAATQIERRRAERQAEVSELTGQIAEATRRRDERTGEMTELRVALGRAEEKKQSIADSLAGLSAQREQMSGDLATGRSEIGLNRDRRTEAERQIDAATQESDRLYAEHQQLNAEAEEVDQTRRSLAERLGETRTALSRQRASHEEASQQTNTLRVELKEVDVRIENLITRAADEMDMELLELYKTYQHDQERDWDAVEAEIDELRGKIERLGNINLDAIAEQEELDNRRDFLTAQLADIRASQNQLNELIRRINSQSRKMFTETFAAVRKNFQQLFRKLFAGGRADILLSDPDDVLESGIEIVARPPGKELRTLSLLSGGEKTLTALALLFSIFRARPSPFCLLDEVDAALDEANTERFARLLQEFNDNSQFVIISHAKRTMGMASVLYGVTMGEPGISKRISVRFEEVDRALEANGQPVSV